MATIGATGTAVGGATVATGGGATLGSLALGGIAVKAAAVVAAVSVAGGVGYVGTKEVQSHRKPAPDAGSDVRRAGADEAAARSAGWGECGNTSGARHGFHRSSREERPRRRPRQAVGGHARHLDTRQVGRSPPRHSTELVAPDEEGGSPSQTGCDQVAISSCDEGARKGVREGGSGGPHAGQGVPDARQAEGRSAAKAAGHAGNLVAHPVCRRSGELVEGQREAPVGTRQGHPSATAPHILTSEDASFERPPRLPG